MSDVMTEDDEIGSASTPAPSGLPPGLIPAGDTPQARAPIAPPVDDFDIIETDSDGRPLGAQPPPQPQSEIRPDADQEAQQHRRPDESNSARRARQRAAREQSENERAALRDENMRLRREFEEFKQGVEPRLTQYDQARLNDQIGTISRDIDAQAATLLAASREMAAAVTAGDGEAHTAALNKHTMALQKGNELHAERSRLEAGRQSPAQAQPRPQPQIQPDPRQFQPQPRVNPVVADLARDFATKHSWIDTQRRGDQDSRIAMAIDDQVMADGFDPADRDYWDEFEDRLRTTLPHRFAAQQPAATPPPIRQQIQQQTQRRGGPPVAAANGVSPPSGRRQVSLTPDRKAALYDAGALDRDGRITDRGKFDRIIRGYADFDRDNGGARQ